MDCDKSDSMQSGDLRSARFTVMLAEKFFLVLETLRSHASDGKPQIVISTTQHISITPPHRKLVWPLSYVTFWRKSGPGLVGN